MSRTHHPKWRARRFVERDWPDSRVPPALAGEIESGLAESEDGLDPAAAAADARATHHRSVGRKMNRRRRRYREWRALVRERFGDQSRITDAPPVGRFVPGEGRGSLTGAQNLLLQALFDATPYDCDLPPED